MFRGWERLPPAAEAMPLEGIVSCPLMLAVPVPSRAALGALLLIPILAVGDEPVWKTAEFPMVAAAVNRGRKLAVPDPVMVAGGGGRLGDWSCVSVEIGLVPTVDGAASMKAEA